MVEAIRQGDIPGVQLRCRQVLPLPVEEAWRWLSEAERLEQWLAASAQVESGDGGWMRLTGEDEAGVPRTEVANTQHWQPPSRWVFTFEHQDAGWPTPTRVTVELTDLPQGSELSVLQDGFQNLPLSTGLTIWEAYRRRWRTALATLAQRLTAS